jgi:hypothetical protein
MVDFIGVYDKVAPSDMCKEIIDFFEVNKELQFRGRTAFGDQVIVEPKVKDSKDMTLSFIDETVPSVIISKILNSYTSLYIDTYRSTDVVAAFSVEMGYNLQRYNPSQGYHLLHCENAARGNERVLAWTLYLNTVTEGGGTYYPEYDRTIDAVEGRLCIFPAFWTHAHKGIVSNTETKYIATGWYIYH